MSKKVFIKTFGCQMNVYDSNRIYDSLKTIGFEKTDNQNQTDCYILNTCHIRDKAKEKVYHEVGRVKKIYQNKKKPIMVIAGCVAQAENDEMFKREPFIDVVIGPQSYHKINNTIKNFFNSTNFMIDFFLCFISYMTSIYKITICFRLIRCFRKTNFFYGVKNSVGVILIHLTPKSFNEYFICH